MTPTLTRTLQIGALLTAVGLGVVPFASDAVREARVPDDGAVAVATRAIRAGFQAGDAVVVDPSWYTLPWHALERMGTGTEAWPYPALYASEDFDVVDAMGHDRLWVLAAFDRPADAPAVIADGVKARVDIPLDVEHVALARYDVAKVERLRTLTADHQQLVVRRGPEGGAMTPCKWRGDRQRCGREGYRDVYREDRVVSHIQTRWLMTVPSDKGEVLEIDWKDLPAKGTWLYLRAGWTMQAVREPAGKATTVTVLVDGREVDRFVLEPHRWLLERRAIRLDAAQPVTVTFRAGTEELDARELMMEADVLGSLPEPLRRWATAVRE
ncbi:MAG: hypothetical protein U1F43_37065 [Myxococcota bacterium]